MTRSTGVANSAPLMVTGRPRSKPTVTSSGAISTAGSQNRHAHDRLDRLEPVVEMLQGLGLVGGAPDVGVGGVGLLGAVAVGQVVGEQPLAHLPAAAELADEGRVQPRLVDAQVRVGQQPVAVEPLDVVALERRAVAPDLDVVLEHRPHQQRAGDRPAQRGGVEVGPAARADMERPAGQRGQALLDQGRAAVDQPGDLGAVGLGPAGDRRDVGLVVLPDVSGVGARHRTLVAHPRDRDRGIEPAGESNADPFTDGQGGDHLGHTRKYAVSCMTMQPPAPGRIASPLRGDGVPPSGPPASRQEAIPVARAPVRRQALHVIDQSVGSLPEPHALRGWRSVVFAPVGDGQRRRRGSDGVRLAAAVLALVCCVLVIRYDSRIDRAIVAGHPPAAAEHHLAGDGGLRRRLVRRRRSCWWRWP